MFGRADIANANRDDMPFISYWIREHETTEELKETEILPRVDDVMAEIRKIIGPLNIRRLDLGISPLEIIRFRIDNPFWHLHTWKYTHKVDWHEKTYYRCEYCEALGYKHDANPNANVTRMPEYQKETYEYCKDHLPELPKLNSGITTNKNKKSR